MVRRGGMGLAALLATCLSLAISAGTATAAPGDVDRSFGNRGWVDLSGLPSSPERATGATDLAIAGDDIYVLTQTSTRCGESFCNKAYVAKLSPVGMRDAAFSARAGVVGEVREGHAHDIAVDSLGRPVVAMSGTDGTSVARLLPDGSADPTFGVNGLADLEQRIDDPKLAFGADGTIVVAGGGTGAPPSFSHVIVSRLRADGAPDRGFGTGGIGAVDVGDRTRVGGVALVGGETAVTAATPGACCDGPALAFRLLRFAPSGRLSSLSDPWSSGDRVSERFNQPDALLATRDGGLRVLGDASGGTPIAGLRPDGRIDRRFAGRGFAFVPKLLRGDNDAAEDRGGRLIVGGTLRPPDHESEPSALAVTRRRPNGRPDRTFAGGTLAALGRGSEESVRVLGVGTQSNGGILLLGRRDPRCARVCVGPPSYFLVRVKGGSSRARCHGRRATIVGTGRSERLVGTPHRDVIVALGGRDRVIGKGGADLICGGRGNDILLAGPGTDRVFGGPGRDVERD